MNDEPSAELVLQLEPAGRDLATLQLRVSRGHVDELRECLEAEGLHVSAAIEHSVANVLEILEVALGDRGPVTTAITAFLNRNKEKKVTFGPQGQLQSLEGYSAKGVERVVGAIGAQQRRLDEQRAKIKGESGSGEDEDEESTST